MSAKKSHPGIFTARPGDEEAAIARRAIELEQKKIANQNLSQLRFMMDVSRDTEGHDAFMADGLLRAIAEDEHPLWAEYDPLDKSERVHRYPLDASHRELLSMINGIYANIAACMNKIIEGRQFDVESTTTMLADISGNALVKSTRRWPFTVRDYAELRFDAHQMLVADSTNVKLFIITVNDTVPFDFFFYFF